MEVFGGYSVIFTKSSSTMRNLILRFCSWALPLLGASAVISCDNVIQAPDMYGRPPAPEYGVPVMQFRISGKAEDAQTGEPVKGIAVTYITEDKYEHPDTTWTSDNGEFIIRQNSFPSDKMTLKFTDVDGADNGEYSVEKVEVTLVRKEESQDGWMVGIYTADDVQVKLDPVQPSDPE